MMFVRSLSLQRYSTLSGQLRNIKQLKPWDIFHVLTEKYKWPPYEALEFTHFLEPMLHYDVNQRATAAECLMNPWYVRPVNHPSCVRLASFVSI